MPFKKNIEQKDTELISLTDVIFLLLIFFLVTATYAYKMTLVRETLKVAIPQTHDERMPTLSTAKKKESIHLLIQAFQNKDDADVKFYLLHECLTPPAISRSLPQDYSRIDPKIWPQVPWVGKRSGDTPDRRYYIGSALEIKQPVNKKIVFDRIKALKDLLKNPRIVIRIEEQLPFEVIVDILGLCNQLKIFDVILTTGDVESLDDFARGG